MSADRVREILENQLDYTGLSIAQRNEIIRIVEGLEEKIKHLTWLIEDLQRRYGKKWDRKVIRRIEEETK